MTLIVIWTWIIVFQVILTVTVIYCDYKKWASFSDPKPPYFKTFWRTYFMLFLFVVNCWGYGFSKGIESVI